MSSYQEDKAVSTPSYLCNGNPHGSIDGLHIETGHYISREGTNNHVYTWMYVYTYIYIYIYTSIGMCAYTLARMYLVLSNILYNHIFVKILHMHSTICSTAIWLTSNKTQNSTLLRWSEGNPTVTGWMTLTGRLVMRKMCVCHAVTL